MHPFEILIKNTLDSGQLTADFYNDYIFPAFKQGIIKDVSPPEIRNTFLSIYEVLHCFIELSDSSRYEIQIWNPPDIMNPDNKYNFRVEVKKLPTASISIH